MSTYKNDIPSDLKQALDSIYRSKLDISRFFSIVNFILGLSDDYYPEMYNEP